MPVINRIMPPMSGAVTPLLIKSHGFYNKGIMPADITVERKVHSALLEMALRARLCAKGALCGLRGTGILGVGRLYASKIFANGGVEHYGLISTKVITNAGVTFLRDDWNNNAQDFTTFNFHGCGTGAVAENVTDTTLGVEQTANLSPANTRATGTRSVPASNQFQTVGTLTFAGPAAITEHGIFSQSATGGGTLWDRSVFAVINVAAQDSIQFTYLCTLSAGG